MLVWLFTILGECQEQFWFFFFYKLSVQRGSRGSWRSYLFPSIDSFSRRKNTEWNHHKRKSAFILKPSDIHRRFVFRWHFMISKASHEFWYPAFICVAAPVYRAFPNDFCRYCVWSSLAISLANLRAETWVCL